MTPEQFMANFGAIAEAQEGVKRLRELVLRLAVEGALSEPLDGDDDPDVLLRSIRKACETTAEDNGWRFKALPDGVEPFCRAPSRWACESLGNLGVALGGGTPSKQRHEFWEGDIPWVSPKDMKRDVIDDSIDHVSELAVESSAAKLIDAPALLMVLRGMILAHSFPVAITSRSVTINQDLKALVLGDSRTAPYLLLAMKAAKGAVLSQVETSSHGTCRLSAAAVLGLGVPIPPIAEQKRIAAKVEQLMAMLDDLEQCQEKKGTVAIHVSKASLDSLSNAETAEQIARAWERVSENFSVAAGSEGGIPELRHHLLVLGIKGMLGTRRSSDEPIQRLVERCEVPLPVSGRKSRTGKEASNAIIPGDAGLSVGTPDTVAPPGWQWLPMHAIACLESGHTPSRRYPEYWDGKIPWIGIKDAREHHGGRIETTLQHVTQKGLDNSAARLLPAGTVCLSRTASVGYVIEMARPMATSQDFVNWVCSEAVHPPFLVKLFLAESRALRRFSKGAVHQTIYFPEVKAFHVCLPPLAEQKRIVTKINHLMSLLDDLEAKSTDLKLAATRLAATGTSPRA